MSNRHVPLPLGEPGASAGAIAAGIDSWITSDPVRHLVHAFGGRWPSGDTAAVLAWLDAFSASHWDFRSGRERPEAREPDLDPNTAGRVVEAAQALGMIDVVPPRHRTYQHLIVLGGLAHACLRRTAYAAHLLRCGGVTVTGEVAALGSFRPLTAGEHTVLTSAGHDGNATEVDALDAGIRAAFDCAVPVDELGNIDDDPYCSWSTRSYRPPDGPPVRVLAAPSSEPAVRRAHTADTQRFWAGQVSLSPGDRVLMVTAPIYVPFQHCDAVRTLTVPYGCGIDTVGVDPRWAVDPRPGTRSTAGRLPDPTLTPGRYLQEIRSAIRAMRALHTSITG